MNLDTVAGKLSFIIFLGFSFALFAASLGAVKADKKYRAFCFAFAGPFIMLSAGYLSISDQSASALFILSGVEIALVLLSFYILRLESHHFGIACFISLCLPAALIIAVLYLDSFRLFVNRPLFLLTTAAACVILNTLLLIKGRAKPANFNWGIYLLGVYTASFTVKGNQMGAIQLVLLLSAALLFYLHFNRLLTKDVDSKLTEAESKLGDLDRMLEREVRKRTYEIERVNRQLVDISRTDPLSKSLTKSAIMDVIDKLILNRMKEFAVLMLDIDYFKTINDKLGHITGDKCIKKLALTAKGCVRDIDHVGRYGGDEFIIVLPSLNSSQAYIVAERFRKKVAETDNPHFTVSIGLSVYPQDGTTVKELIDAADQGLYKSKENGRNTTSHKTDF